MGFTNAVSTIERSGIRVNASYSGPPSLAEENLERTTMYWKNPLPAMAITDDSILQGAEAKIAHIVRQKQVTKSLIIVPLTLASLSHP
jgi:hypothetical protein